MNTACTNAPVPIRILHCWQDGDAGPIGPCVCACGCKGTACNDCALNCWMGVRFKPHSTCLLVRGHKVPHDFTPDERIDVAFTGGLPS